MYFSIVKHVGLYSGRCFQRKFSHVENFCPRKWVKINTDLRRPCDVETMRNNESLAGCLLEYRLLLPRGHTNISCFACSNVCDKANSLLFIYCFISLFSLFPPPLISLHLTNGERWIVILFHMVYFIHCYSFKIFPYACNVFHFQSGISVRVRRRSLVISNMWYHFFNSQVRLNGSFLCHSHLRIWFWKLGTYRIIRLL